MVIACRRLKMYLKLQSFAKTCENHAKPKVGVCGGKFESTSDMMGILGQSPTVIYEQWSTANSEQCLTLGLFVNNGFDGLRIYANWITAGTSQVEEMSHV